MSCIFDSKTLRAANWKRKRCGNSLSILCSFCNNEQNVSLAPRGLKSRRETIGDYKVSATIQRQVPLLDLRAQHRQIRTEVLAEVTRVIDSQMFIMGEDVRKLEQEIADYCNCQFAIGCASGSDALFLALLAAGVLPGEQVLTTPYTFFATAGAIARAGAVPVFADIDPVSFNLDVSRMKEVLDRQTRIRIVIPVHLFGACADMDPIMNLARERELFVIEDAAQSIGADYKNRRAGSLGNVGCFSFFPSKNLGAYGDGGILTTNDTNLAEMLAALRVHGAKKKYVHEIVGVNSRLDALQAAILRVKFRYLDSWTLGRQQNADRYRRFFSQRLVPVQVPALAPHTTRHIYNQFVICCARRDELQAYLKQHGIGTEVYYPIPLHLQKCFAGLGYERGDFPVSERLALESLALPIHPELPADDLEFVCETIRAFYAQE
jgi:dTDP-4-amino-4,6-dideoxygalactose transaminase